ncbi:MAG: metallophosphoesterase [Bacteroidota bacterium]
MKIAHVSDIHFGRIAFPHILDALIEDVAQANVDMVAVSGDLTQRALHKQFREALAFLNRFTAPYMVVPGNHDVYPWWSPWMRLVKPVARFQTYFGADLVRTHEQEGLAVMGFNSAHGLTIKGGKVTSAIVRGISDFFDRQPAGAFKVLMLHHHLTTLEGLIPHDISINGTEALAAAQASQVDLILCGHAHVSHVESLEIDNEKGPVVASAGTATSSRGRRSNRHRNFYNLIEILPGAYSIHERTYKPDDQCFAQSRTFHFNR